MTQSNKVITFGCRLNLCESEVIEDILAKKNLNDVVVFNTCAVTKQAEQESIRSIRKFKRENPDMRIVVTGCASQLHVKKFSELAEVEAVIANKDKMNAGSYAGLGRECGERRGHEELATSTNASPLVGEVISSDEPYNPALADSPDRTRALVKIQDGCNNRCSFCMIPYARGNSVSTPLETILERVRVLNDRSYKEIVLTGVNIVLYGRDLPVKSSLGQAVQAVLDATPQLPRIRLSSLDVSDIDEILLRAMTSEPRLMPHLHLSLQSGNNSVLRKMRRKHTREQALTFCETIRSFRPDVGFGADVIAGFPTETEEMFENTCAFLEESQIPFLHVFPYSEREITPAATLPQLPIAVRKRRAKAMRDIGQRSLDAFSQRHVGRTVEVLTEGGNVGRMQNFLRVHLQADREIAAGVLVKVQITDYHDGKLCASLF